MADTVRWNSCSSIAHGAYRAADNATGFGYETLSFASWAC